MDRRHVEIDEESMMHSKMTPQASDAPSIEPTSRRGMLCSGAVLLCAGAVLPGLTLASEAVAAAKVPQGQAGYQSSPRGEARCDKCLQFQPPSACKIVDGAVSPSGSCNFFAARPR
jgi:hypothetical protein